jgi:hypothetical protein
VPSEEKIEHLCGREIDDGPQRPSCAFITTTARFRPGGWSRADMHHGRHRAAQMHDSDPTEPFYLIVTDYDRDVLAVESPMTDDRPWETAAR